MLLRSISKHVREQNWFAVVLDFLIVVVGILIAFQITEWNEERSSREDESELLHRLHSDIVELQERRAVYEKGRPRLLQAFNLVTQFLYGEEDDFTTVVGFQVQFFPELANYEGLPVSFLCNHFEWTDALTIPPSALPTATEMVSSGRVNYISSGAVKSALQSYLQQLERADDYIGALAENTIRLTETFPELFEIRASEWDYVFNGQTFSHYHCDYDEMKSNSAFLNALEVNVRTYSNYTYKGIFPVSEKLTELHQAVDAELDIDHAFEGTN